MKFSKKLKTNYKKNKKLWWGVGSLFILLLGMFLLINYTKLLDVRSRADESKIQFIDHTISKVEGQDMSITVEKPETAQPGDMLVAMIGSDYAHVDTFPDGWTQIRQDVKNKGHKDDLALQSCYKVVSEDEQTPYTWNFATKRKDTPSEHQPLIAVDLYVLRGVAQDNPIFSSDIHGESENPEAIKCPSVHGVSQGMLICGYMGDDPGTITAPDSMTQTSNFEIAGGDSFASAYEILTSDDKTGNRTASWNNPDRTKKGKLKNGSDFGQAIVLRPAE